MRSLIAAIFVAAVLASNVKAGELDREVATKSPDAAKVTAVVAKATELDNESPDQSWGRRGFGWRGGWGGWGRAYGWGGYGWRGHGWRGCGWGSYGWGGWGWGGYGCYRPFASYYAYAPVYYGWGGYGYGWPGGWCW